MKKICLVVGNTLPVPAVMGGAVEELITMLLDQNEIEQKAEFIIFSRFHHIQDLPLHDDECADKFSLFQISLRTDEIHDKDHPHRRLHHI